MRTGRILSAVVLALTLTGAARAESVAIEPPFQAESYRRGPAPDRFEGEPSRLLFEHDDLRISTPSPRDRAWGRATLHRSGTVRGGGDGGGGDVAEMDASQTRYLDSNCDFDPQCGGPCNEVLLTWTENSFNPDGVVVLVDGEIAGTVPGIRETLIPGTNSISISNVAPGPHTFGTEESNTGTTGEASLVVVDSQPFADADHLRCGESTKAGQTSCELLTRWANSGLAPAEYMVFINGTELGSVGGQASEVFGPVLPVGTYCVEVVGRVTSAEGSYRGCFVPTCCTLNCLDLACAPPVNLEACQITYGPNLEDNVVWLTWSDTVTPYEGGVNVFDNGAAITNVAAGDEFVFLISAPGRTPFFGVQGDCGVDPGTSTVTREPFTVLFSTPHPNPTEGTPRCVYDADAGSSTITWKNADPSAFVYVIREDTGAQGVTRTFLQPALPGRAESVVVPGTQADTPLFLQFFTYVNGMCYGSEMIQCQTPSADRFFIRGTCDGSGANPQITTAIFGLNHLFLGGAAPPCREACDVDGDGKFILTDMVQILLFLFQSGPPPAGWTDRDGDGTADPTCEILQEGMDCAEPLEACPV